MNTQEFVPIILDIDDEGGVTLPPELLQACGLSIGEEAVFDVEVIRRTAVLRPVIPSNAPKHG